MDITNIESVVNDADVFALGFRLFPERLLIDTRYDEREMPMVAIVDPVETLQERYFWMGQHRPTLGMPAQFHFFFWPHSVRYLEESGVWEKICRRVVASGFTGARETCDAALEDLRQRELQATCGAIRGEHYETLWEANKV